MRIALLTRRFPPERCGVGDCAAQLARAFESRGDEVVVFTAPSRAALRPPRPGLVELPMRGWGDLPALVRALVAAKPERVQFEYSNYAWSRGGCALWLNALAFVLRWRRLPLHLALHEFSLRIRQHPRLALLALVQRAHLWLLAAAAQDVLTNTYERVRILRRGLPWKRGRIHYRPNGSNIPVSPIAIERRLAVRAAAGARENDIVVALFGTFQSGKNFEAVIEAVRRLQDRLPLHLWLLGDTAPARPAYLDALRKTAGTLKRPAFWSGALAAAEMSAHLQAADVFVLPQADGHLTRSGSFMAAAAHGLPAIAVRNGENQREFAHGRNVWLAERSTPGEFARALGTLARDAALRRGLGAGLQRLYRARFDWPVLAGADAALAGEVPSAQTRAIASPAEANPAEFLLTK